MTTSHKRASKVTLAVCLLMLGLSASANTLPTNPFGLQYDLTTFTNDSSYYQATGMLIAGNCNASDSHFQSARAGGAEVLEYVNPVDVADNVSSLCGQSFALYRWSALWPFPASAPGSRSNFSGTHIGDIRVGSAWSNAVVSYVENLMISGTVDGVFLDVLGANLSSTLAAWSTWPSAEQDAFTNGAVDLVRRLDSARRALNPRFIIVNNNTWERGDSLGIPGEWYVDGICIEHHPSTDSFFIDNAGRTFSNLGHRRVLSIATSTAEAGNWAAIQGVTHVSDQSSYSFPTPPPITFHALTDRASTPQFFGQTTIALTPSAGLNADFKRGSLFTIASPSTFHLVGLSAYLDGLGAASGSQQVSMALYSNSGGVPANLLATSNTVTISAGQVAGWVHFSTPSTSLTAGSYWIVIHSGATGGIIRDFGTSGGSWYGNSDTFADGSSNPFGSGTSGSTTMSVYAVFTP